MTIKSGLLLAFQLALIFVMNLFVYSLIHEIGHAIIAIACGGKISRLKLGGDYFENSNQCFYKLYDTISSDLYTRDRSC